MKCCCCFFQEIKLDNFNREQLNNLLVERGFHKKGYPDEELAADVINNLKYKSRDEL